MRIEIYADLVCPWCYLGQHRFDKALAGFPGAGEAVLTWRPFQLDPQASTNPVPHLQAYAAKVGDPTRVEAAVADLQAAAAAEDLPLRLDLAQRVNTFDAHRLIALALVEGGSDLQRRVVERLLRAYFTEGRNLADHGELAVLAKDSGLRDVDVSGYLGSDTGSAQLRAELEQGRALGLDSVPTYVFERRWAVSGAQSPKVMGQVLRQIEAAITGGGCCGGGGCACSA